LHVNTNDVDVSESLGRVPAAGRAGIDRNQARQQERFWREFALQHNKAMFLDARNMKKLFDGQTAVAQLQVSQ
jgi:hypothetical protein